MLPGFVFHYRFETLPRFRDRVLCCVFFSSYPFFFISFLRNLGVILRVRIQNPVKLSNSAFLYGDIF